MAAPADELPRDYRMMIWGFCYVSQAIEQAMYCALRDCKIPPKKKELAALRLWAHLQQTLVNGMPGRNAIQVHIDQSIKDLADRLKIELTNASINILINGE
jgi:hypothetical protein